MTKKNKYSPDRVGGLKLVPLSSPSLQATGGDVPLASMGHAQPDLDASQDNETGGNTGSVDGPPPTTPPPTTTNAVCTVWPTQRQITEMFERILKGGVT